MTENRENLITEHRNRIFSKTYYRATFGVLRPDGITRQFSGLCGIDEILADTAAPGTCWKQPIHEEAYYQAFEYYERLIFDARQTLDRIRNSYSGYMALHGAGLVE